MCLLLLSSEQCFISISVKGLSGQGATVVEMIKLRVVDSAFVLAQIVAALPVDTIKSLLFGTILYWLAGFQDDVGRFLFFLLAVWIFSLAMNQFARCVCAGAPNRETAQAVSPIMGITMMTFAG